MKHAYQWIGISADDLAKGLVRIRNKYQFINLDDFTCSWTLSENGTEIQNGTVTLPEIGPGKELSVMIPFKIKKINREAEYFLRVSFTLSKDQIWAKQGFEVASQQFHLPFTEFIAIPMSATLQPAKMTKNAKEITVTGNGFSVVFDVASGTFTRLERNGINILKDGGGPRLHLWRAPHRNDDMWANGGWTTSGLKELKWTIRNVTADQVSASGVQISVRATGEGKNGFTVNHDVVYTITGDGMIRAENSFKSDNPQQVVGRIGVRMILDKKFENVEYFGRGPMENYSDRKRGFDVGVYKNTVAGLMTPYEKPMDAGNHEDVRWVKITDAEGNGMKATADGSLLQFTAIPYTDEVMEETEYRVDLPESESTVLCLSCRTLGVGSASCGPKPLNQYIIYASPVKFTYLIQLLAENK
jgi:beta-galactosidase